jgi:hypothetical protein
MIVRAIVVGLGILCLAGAAFMMTAGRGTWIFSIELGVLGILILATTFFERRYRGAKSGATTWQDTGERFIDPTTGRLTQVRYNPQTGERAYLPADDKK